MAGMFDDLIPKATSEPPVYIDRAKVPSTARVVGDDEAVARGLYDPPPGSAPAKISFDDLIPKNDALSDARAKLAEGLDAGERGDAEIYKTAAFRTLQGVPKAGAGDLAASGATFGLGDEFAAAATAPIDMIRRGESFSEAYNHNRAAMVDRLDQYRKANPGAAIASEAVGGIAAAPVKAAVTVPRLAAQSAVMGGVGGAGHSEGNRISDAAAGAALGGAVGVGVPAVVGAAKALASPFTRNASALVNPEGRAIDVLRRDLARDGVSPGQVATQLSEASGKPMALADVGGRNVMGTARAVATGKGQGSERLNAMLEARKLDAPARIMDDVKSALGSPEAFYPTIEGIIARRKEIAAPLYERAYAQPMPETEIVKSILSTPAGQQAVKNANRLSANEGIEFAADVRGLDLIKRSFDDMIDAARRGGQNNEARIMAGMKDRLVREVDRRVPEYRAAREAYSSQFDLEQAIERGRSFLRVGTDAEVAVKEIRAMSAAERDVARIGMAREIKSMFDDPRYTLSRANQLLNSGRLSPIVDAMFETRHAANQFRASLAREAAMLKRGQQIQGGSNTANKLAETDDLNVTSAAVEVLSGRPIRAALSVAANVGGRVAKGINEKTADRLADILTTTDPAKQRAILDQIERMLPPGAITRLLGGLSGREAPTLRRAGT